MGSDEHGKGSQRQGSTKDAVSGFSWDSYPGKRLLEVFAGSGRLSQAAQSRGLPMFPIDIMRGCTDDVLNKHVQCKIFSLVTSGKVLFVWIGMPCTTFSRARQHDGIGPPPLRSDQQPMGLSNLRPHDLRKLREGNALFYFTVRLINLCEQHRVAWALENPATSRCWITSQLQQLEQGSSSVLLDFCQFGESWRKRTKILFKGIDFSCFEQLCHGTGNLCSRTGKHHLNLKGVSPTGAFWTLVAQPYPWLLVDRISEMLLKRFQC